MLTAQFGDLHTHRQRHFAPNDWEKQRAESRPCARATAARNDVQESVRSPSIASALAIVFALGVVFGLGLAAPAESQTTYRIPRSDEGAVLDATLDEPAWSTAVRFELGFETRPGENIPPPVRTECRMFFTSSHLYYGCHAFDDPKQIRARLRDRDASPFADDVVGLVIDPFNNNESSLIFDVNPLGVQNDRRYTELDGNSDSSWDATWASSGRITDDGFIVEVAIPFRALRFPRTSGEQTWGFNFRRYQPRDVSRRIALFPNDRSNACRACQSGQLVGLMNLDPGSNLEITPTVTGIQVSERTDFPGGTVESEDPDIEGGLTAKWGITPNLILGGTINPDFSQVEADVAQLDVNQQFSLFFPERRPFFLEGADTFNTHKRIIYTRSVADPSFGLKLSGRQGPHQVGMFAAEDEQTSFLFPESTGSSLGSVQRSSTAAALRYRRDLGNASSLGLVYTDRSGRDYENRTAGVDGRVRLTQADTVEFQLLGSQTKYPEDIRALHDQAAGQLEDWFGYVSYSHEERNWNTTASYEEVGGDFRADLGFIPQVDYREFELEGEYEWYAEADHWYTNFSVAGELERAETRDGIHLADKAGAWIDYSGPLQTKVATGYQYETRTLGGVEFDNSTFWAEGGYQPSATLGLGFGVEIGDGIDFAQARQGERVSAGPFVALELGKHLQATLSHTYSALDLDASELPAGAEDDRLFTANQVELRVVYQFSIRSFLRAIVQYTDVTRDQALYAGTVPQDEADLFGQLLFSYKVNPLTALYIGYSGAYFDLERSGLIETGNTVFLKLGYAWMP